MAIGDGSVDVIGRLVRWAERQPLVRTLILESSRARDDAPIDALSDYDVALVVADVRPYVESEAWLSDFDTPLVRFRDSGLTLGIPTYNHLVLYEDRTKIDYLIWPVELLRLIVAESRLPDVLDWGYRVLLDKDGLADRLPAPTRTAYILARPTEHEYLALVEEFWWETTYAAKNLWRDELIQAKYNLEYVMKLDLLRRLLEWRIELDHDWSLKPGVAGSGLKKLLPAGIWSALERTYAGASIEENWEALFSTTSLFSSVARAVGAALGYDYPAELDSGVTAYLEEVRKLPR